jgi:hypothetical protein
MKLQPLTTTSICEAQTLLQEGFPDRSADFWDRALYRLLRYPGNPAADVPIGYLMRVKDDLAGVVLTPAKPARDGDGVDRIVNLSSWYVRPAYRWQAPMMLKKILELKDTAFTDLTPTEPVQKMLESFDFEVIRQGMSLNLLPLDRLKSRSGCYVKDLDSDAMVSMHDDLARSVAAHREFGCLTAELCTPEETFLTAFKIVKTRGIRCAMLVYCEKNEAIYRNLPAIAQYLIEKGIYILVFDIPPGQDVPGIARRPHARRYARGLNFAHRTDYLGSELSVFDW